MVPGAGAFQIACAAHLDGVANKQVKGKAQFGVKAFAEALLIIPKTLAANSGHDIQDSGKLPFPPTQYQIIWSDSSWKWLN